MIEYLWFLHIAGMIIGLGAVTVIDILGFLSRKSKYWTKITIGAHHVTKPLIWAGITLIAVTWIFLFEQTTFGKIKTALIVLLITNGSFLSFYVSPRLDKTKGLFSPQLQKKVIISMITSFICWWGTVLITVNTLI
jgi:hypothetical protein